MYSPTLITMPCWYKCSCRQNREWKQIIYYLYLLLYLNVDYIVIHTVRMK